MSVTKLFITGSLAWVHELWDIPTEFSCLFQASLEGRAPATARVSGRVRVRARIRVRAGVN